mgnify:CR=1 FL=1
MLVVYFDYWTGGIRNFFDIDKELKSAGIDTMLFHLGSWNESAVKPHEKIQQIDCFDISSYATNYIYKVLEKLSPDVPMPRIL